MRASELIKFSHSKTAISLNILLVLQILSETFNFRCHFFSIHIQSMQFPIITHGMVLYINDSIYTDTTLTLRKCMCMRASEASELRKFRYFYILKLLFLSIFPNVPTHFPMYRQISKCTDKSPKRHYWGGGAIAPPGPPPPPPPPLIDE